MLRRKPVTEQGGLPRRDTAKAKGRPLIDVVRGVDDAKVTTLVEPGPGVVHQAVRQGRGRRVFTDELPE
jgi:hypothetical protein